MLTSRQKQLLEFIHERISQSGVSPSFDEMKDALDLASKSGVHRLVSSLEERGFLRRLPNRARALEVVKMPDSSHVADKSRPALPRPLRAVRPSAIAETSHDLPIMGRIAAGVPISAIESEIGRIPPPVSGLDNTTHFALQVQGDSMVNAGICNGDTVIFHQCEDAPSGTIIIALIDGEEATLKRLRKHKDSIALEAANPNYETRIFGPGRVQIQGRLVALVRNYH